MSVSEWKKQGDELYRVVKFDQYKDALDFVMKVGRVAELKNHHPKIIIDYVTVELFLTTHDENGITSKDYDLAEMINHLILEMNLI